jgi:hypothetical protein
MEETQLKAIGIVFFSYGLRILLRPVKYSLYRRQGGTDMASRDRNKKGKSDTFDYCIMQVLLSKQGEAAGTREQMRLMTVDNHLETLRFVQNNLDACIGNIVRLKRMEDYEINR